MARLGTISTDGSDLENVSVTFSPSGVPHLAEYPDFTTRSSNHFIAQTKRGEVVYFTLDPDLQRFVQQSVARIAAPHVAVVVMDPANGSILALAGKSNSLPNPVAHAGFPSASVFKLITAAGALERRAIDPSSTITFRGGNYTLSEANYQPDARKDRRVMGVGEALGRSCNPVFGRVALRFLSPSSLLWYAESFGFNQSLDFDAPLPMSRAVVPSDAYGLSRTGAGFGEVTMSPVHAAAMTSGIGNGGLLPRPHLIDRIVSAGGSVLYQSKREYLKRMVSSTTSGSLLQMMEYTTTVGTSRKAFMNKQQPVLGSISVAGKTGTLHGENPEGINNWFVGVAPMDQPKVAISVVVVNPGGASSKASHVARQVLEKFFNVEPRPAPAQVVRVASKAPAASSKKKRSLRRS